MYLVAFAQFVALGRVRLKQPHIAALGWTKEHIDDMLFYGVLGVVLGGRLGEVVFYNLSYYLANPLEILMVWKGGMSFHGGFLGVLIAMSLWARNAKMPLVHVYDFIAPLVPLGYAAGRIGNFINHFDLDHICNHSDYEGRYSFGNQPSIGLWNLEQLGLALGEFITKEDRERTLLSYPQIFHFEYRRLLSAKLGLDEIEEGDDESRDGLLRRPPQGVAAEGAGAPRRWRL